MSEMDITLIFIGLMTLVLATIWVTYYVKGKQFALRDQLRKADAIVVLAGSRGNIKFLDGKIRTAVRLYHQGWAPYIICSGKFSAKVTDKPNLIPMEELQEAVKQGRIQQKDIANAAKIWDTNLGANYLRDKAISMGVPAEKILIENESLHTRENAEYVLDILRKKNFSHVILVTSPFHQLRTYLTFAKVFQPYNIGITNYYADTGEWHPATWFLRKEHRKLVKGEIKRIKLYRAKGDLL